MMVFIIGMTGVGKSTIGRLAARRLGYAFVDLDAWIEVRSGKRVHELITQGEAVFRQWETDSLKSLKTQKPTIIATGGGIVTREENIKWMRDHGYVVWLRRDVHHILKHFNTQKRPLMKNNPDRLYDLYQERRALYIKAHHMAISCTHKHSGIKNLVEVIRRYENSRS